MKEKKNAVVVQHVMQSVPKMLFLCNQIRKDFSIR